jgi:hypothetical protein
MICTLHLIYVDVVIKSLPLRSTGINYLKIKKLNSKFRNNNIKSINDR